MVSSSFSSFSSHMTEVLKVLHNIIAFLLMILMFTYMFLEAPILCNFFFAFKLRNTALMPDHIISSPFDCREMKGEFRYKTQQPVLLHDFYKIFPSVRIS